MSAESSAIETNSRDPAAVFEKIGISIKRDFGRKRSSEDDLEYNIKLEKQTGMKFNVWKRLCAINETVIRPQGYFLNMASDTSQLSKRISASTLESPSLARVSIKMEGQSSHEKPFSFLELPENRYLIIEKVGEGSFGSVWKATDTKKNAQLVALKRLVSIAKPHRVRLEVVMLGLLRGLPNVVQFLAGYRRGDQVTLVLEYFPHDEFRDYYTQLSFNETSVYIYQLFVALRAIHQKEVVHRDIKPANCLFNRRTYKFCLADFGLAESLERFKPTNDRKYDAPPNRAGTRGFRPPEVILRPSKVNKGIDIWAAGVMMMVLASRRYPFWVAHVPGHSLSEIIDVVGSQAMINAAAAVPGCRLHCDKREPRPLRDFCSRLRNDDSLSSYSEAFFDLMRRCLEPDDLKRITAEEALHHEAFAHVPALLAAKAKEFD